MQEIGNELDEFRKTGYKSINNKLRIKIQSVKDHLEVIIPYIGIELTELENYEPIGIIVTNFFSFSNVLNDKLYPIIPFDILVDWLRSNRWKDEMNTNAI